MTPSKPTDPNRGTSTAGAERLDARTLARSRRDAMRRRARRIRHSVAAATATVFAVAFLAIYVQLASGHDPALSTSAKTTPTTATTASSSSATKSSSTPSSSTSSSSGKESESSSVSEESSSTSASSGSESESSSGSEESSSSSASSESGESATPVTTSQS